MAFSLECPSKTTLEIYTKEVVGSGPTEAAAVADVKSKVQAEAALISVLVNNSFECDDYGRKFEAGGQWQGSVGCAGTKKITDNLQDVLNTSPTTAKQQDNNWTTIAWAPAITYTITCGAEPPKSSKDIGIRQGLVPCEGMLTFSNKLHVVGTGATAAATDDAEQKFLSLRFSVLDYLLKIFHCKNACQKNNLDRTNCCQRFSHTDFDKNTMKPAAPTKTPSGSFQADCEHTIKFTVICQKTGATTYSGLTLHPEPEED